VETLGRYRLIRRVAVGGMAEIFLAEQPGASGLARRVAIKRILPHRADDAEFVNMFLNEARVAALLNHPHIVKIYDMGEEDHRYYIAMEFVQGYDLGQILDQSEEKGQQIPPIYIATILAQAAAGLNYAHFYKDYNTGQALNLIHRDISLPNIMVSLDGNAKVLDFGIAKAATNERQAPTQTGVLKGKVSYMSPEYLNGEMIDWRHDLFAIGVVMYELLTGQKPFKAKGDVQMLQAILTQHPQDPYHFNPTIPEPLYHILMRLLEKDRNRRYQSGAELEQDLHFAIQQIAGYEVGPNHIAHYIRGLFAGSPYEVHPFTETETEGQQPPLYQEPSHSRQLPPSTPSYQPPADHYPPEDEPFNPFGTIPESTPAPFERNAMPVSRPPLPDEPLESWQVETKCLPISEVAGAPQHAPEPSSPGIPSEEATAALIIGEDGSMQVSSMGQLEEISREYLGTNSAQPASRRTPTPPPSIPRPATPPPSMRPPSEILRPQQPTAPTPPAQEEEDDDDEYIYGLIAIVVLLVLIIGGAYWFFSGPSKPKDPPDTSDTSITYGSAAKRPNGQRGSIPQPPGGRKKRSLGSKLLLEASSPPCPCTVYWANRKRKLGYTPVRYRLPSGKHRFILQRKRPYVYIPLNLNLAPGKLNKQFIKIQKGSLILKLKPWANVTLDGQFLGKNSQTPYTVYAGWHTLKLEHPQLKTARTFRMFVRNGEQKQFTYTMPLPTPTPPP